MLGILKIIYSIWFNIRYLPLTQAVKMPVLISTNMRIEKLKKGQIIIEKPVRLSVTLGGGKSPAMNAMHGCLYVSGSGKIIFHGKASVSQGTVLRCDDGGVIEIGDQFYCNCNCYFRSGSLIRFGDDCALGWNITVNSSDGHHVWHNGKKVTMEGPISVGNHVWMASECSLLKNSSIPDNCVVTQKAVVTKHFENQHCLIGGIPAKVISNNIEWKK